MALIKARATGDKKIMCDEHAHAAWVRVCEIVSACVIAACVADWGDARADAAEVAERETSMPEDCDRADAVLDRAQAALLGYASVEAMREEERET